MINKFKEVFKVINTGYTQLKFRKLVRPNVTELIHSEDSSVHWKYLDVKNKTVLDLGCGLWGVSDIKETSPVYFKNKGAKKIIGVDMNANDIAYFNTYFKENYKNDESCFFVKKITSSNDLTELINAHQVESIKCDIEGFEKVLFSISKSQLKNVGSISVEYHNHALFLNLINTFKNWDFKIVNHSIFSYGWHDMGVLTANKK